MSANYSDLIAGTPITWKNTGGTHVLNAKALANAGRREGDKRSTSLVDGTYGFPEVLKVVAETKVQSTPTDGREFNVYLAFSSSGTAGTDNPAGLTGSDAAIGDTDQLPQLTLAGAIIMAGSLTTGVQRQSPFWVPPRGEYVAVCVHNDTGQTTSNVDGETVVTVTPYYRRTPIA